MSSTGREEALSTPRPRALQTVRIVGRGKVGTALARAAVLAGLHVEHVSSRPGDRTASRSRGRPPADLVIVAVADAAVESVALAHAASTTPSAMVHTAGLLEPEHLAALRSTGWAVGQAHPLVSFAGAKRTGIEGATLLVGGDAGAIRRARQLARALGMHALVASAVDRAAWHAVAAMVANGAAALASLGAARWEREGIGARVASRALGALLASVAMNVEALGAQRALSGPVRRGDAPAIRRHLDALAPRLASGSGAPSTEPRDGLVRLAHAALALAQIPVARGLGEASPDSLAEIEHLARTVLLEALQETAGQRVREQPSPQHEFGARPRKRP